MQMVFNSSSNSLFSYHIICVNIIRRVKTYPDSFYLHWSRDAVMICDIIFGSGEGKVYGLLEVTFLWGEKGFRTVLSGRNGGCVFNLGCSYRDRGLIRGTKGQKRSRTLTSNLQPD